MSYLKHKVYGIIYKLFRYTKIDENKVSFVIDSNQSFKGNLNYIKREFERRGNFTFSYFYKDKLSFKNFSELSRSKYIFLNDNFFPFAFMDFKAEQMIIQLWHAPGAFKKFGASVDEASKDILLKISDKTDYLIVTSDNIKDSYSEAFQIDKSKIKALGLARLDYYFEDHDREKLKKDFASKYNFSPDLKIILYAPTFRENSHFNNVFDYLNIDEFNTALGDEYVLGLRLHPKIKDFYSGDISSQGKYIDVSDYENEQELLLISDILITDYSSIMIEFAVLNKPIIFFTYDFESYVTDERGFYFDFKSGVPGPIVYNDRDLIDVILKGDFKNDKLSDFVSSQFSEIDGQASRRIVDFVLNNGGENE